MIRGMKSFFLNQSFTWFTGQEEQVPTPQGFVQPESAEPCSISAFFCVASNPGGKHFCALCRDSENFQASSLWLRNMSSQPNKWDRNLQWRRAIQAMEPFQVLPTPWNTFQGIGRYNAFIFVCVFFPRGWSSVHIGGWLFVSPFPSSFDSTNSGSSGSTHCQVRKPARSLKADF